MKKLLLLIFIPFLSYSQGNINTLSKVKYTLLDSYSKSISPFLGDKTTKIVFNLIELKNLVNDSIIYGVEVNLNTNEKISAGSSIAFANIGSFWGVSNNITYKDIQKSGYIFLDKNDMSNILNFLNKVIVFSSQPQEKLTIYKITIRDNFVIGMVYDPKNNSNKWEFFFKVNEAVAKMKRDKGYPLLLSLSKFNKFLNENQKN